MDVKAQSIWDTGYPSAPSPSDFLDCFVAQGGKLMLKGNSTHDFNGQDIRGRFETPNAHTPVRIVNQESLSGGRSVYASEAAR